ncbi:MAG TPA: flagellar export chaperone FliS, partial [Rhodocyclaceae bacterium]|nr:flagellar export chaperone FliS [Rhodocyclaceae bacterium]
LDTQAGGDLAERLDALYGYMSQRLVMANLKNDPAILDEVTGLLNEIRTAWAEIANDPAVVSKTSSAA